VGDTLPVAPAPPTAATCPVCGHDDCSLIRLVGAGRTTACRVSYLMDYGTDWPPPPAPAPKTTPPRRRRSAAGDFRLSLIVVLLVLAVLAIISDRFSGDEEQQVYWRGPSSAHATTTPNPSVHSHAHP
jgi:hypothetical protein